MALRNGVDVIGSEVVVRDTPDGFFDVISVVETLEYSGCTEAFADFLAQELREGRTLPREVRNVFETLREDPFLQP